MNVSISFCTIWLACMLPGAEQGPLVIIGGGTVPDQVRRAFVDIGGREKTILAILPQASSRPDRGKASLEVYTALGVKEAYIVELDDLKKARAQISKATAIWFPGGRQTQLYESLKKAGLIDLLRARHRAGVAFAGSSAGAAIMSEMMIPGAPEKPGLVTGNTPVAKGLGLLPEFIVDQHFVARRRMNRLLGAVLDHPNRLGVGIGESTAIVVRGATFSVMGKGSIIVIDAREAETAKGKAGALQSASNIKVHVLKAGQSFRFK